VCVRKQVVKLHRILEKAAVKASPTVLWCYKKDLGFGRYVASQMVDCNQLCDTDITIIGRAKWPISQHHPLTAGATYRCGAHLRFIVLSRQWANTQCYGW